VTREQLAPGSITHGPGELRGSDHVGHQEGVDGLLLGAFCGRKPRGNPCTSSGAVSGCQQFGELFKQLFNPALATPAQSPLPEAGNSTRDSQEIQTSAIARRPLPDPLAHRRRGAFLVGLGSPPGREASTVTGIPVGEAAPS
jgi:hypothetical protein